jgi:RND family efflux transporter MFP subunit
MPSHPLTKLFPVLLLALLPVLAQGQDPEKNQAPPPMLVEVAEVRQGTAEPLIEMVGTIHFARVSRVASEIAGIVEQLNFREGDRVKAGQPLVQLRRDLLEIAVAGTRASYQQVLVEVERAGKDLRRTKALYEEKLVAEALYDENHYAVLALKKRAAALKATLDRQQLELRKTTITAPFDGLVQSKLTEQGEWVPAGGPVAVIADDRSLEAHVDVPQQLLGYLQPDQPVAVRAGAGDYQARFLHFIPQGDVATRTFTIKLQLENGAGLIEGMAAHTLLPNGPKLESLLVPRDAVLRQFGQDVLFLVEAGKARMIPVQILGYQGMQVAVTGEGLAVGGQVVIKGNERLRDGQAIRF